MTERGYLCDRCGAPKEGHNGQTFHIGDTPIREIGWVTLRSKTGYKRDIDLCDKCMKDLAAWFCRKNCND